MKLELSVAALERLLGGNTEIEVALRHQIVETFAKKHLYALINSAAFKAVNEDWMTKVQEQLTAVITSLQAERAVDPEGHASYAFQSFSWNLRPLIETMVLKIIREEVQKVINYQKSYVQTDIERAVKHAMQQNVKKLVEEGIQKRLKAAQDVTESNGGV